MTTAIDQTTIPPGYRYKRRDDAGEPISSASLRLRALATLSGSLTDALDPNDAAKLVEQAALGALGASSAVVVTLGRFPPEPGSHKGTPGADAALYLIHAVGVPDEVKAALQELPLNAPEPLAEVARSGEALFVRSVADLKDLGEWGQAMIRADAEAAAIVPVWANGEMRGVLGLAWSSPQDFDDDDCAFVLTLGVMCAQALLRSHLREAETSARRAAERANLSKSNFITMITHELRTPLNAVIGYSELISQGIDGPLTSRQSDHIGKMQQSSGHLLTLIEELLGHARLEAGEESVQPEPVMLIEMIESTLVLVKPLAEQKGIGIRVESSDKSIQLFTDPNKLRQILINLLGNAIKFTEIGDVVLLVNVHGAEAPIKIVFKVTDTGKGMTEDVQAHIFDAFWQADPTAALKSGGTGLGLPIARQLARLLGGDLEIEASAPGTGSTFVVTLPLRYQPVQKKV
ncbi:MAG TPA: ATP-binding protein [Longimicrobiales bacterium]